MPQPAFADPGIAPDGAEIIFTWNTRLMDGSMLRLPRSRITDRNGAPMEMYPRPVDVDVKRPIGENYGPRDSQLDRGSAGAAGAAQVIG